MKDEKIYIEHILENISKIEEYVDGISKEKFLGKSIIQDAVIRKIEIIGEASKFISKKTKEKNQKIPWKDIAGMRDKLIHSYFGVDLDSVWETIKKDIPSLKKEIENLF